MSSVDLTALIREREAQFIEKRVMIENEVNRFLASLETLDDSIKQQIEYVPGQTARDILPALWAEKFDKEAYQLQLNKLNACVSRVRLICDEINQEALRCLQES